MTARFILASASARRRDLLTQIGLVPDAIVSPDIDETPRPGETPRLLAERLARAKLDSVDSPGDFVLAADTVVAAGRRILPKAEDEATARRCLALLSGRRHRVHSAIALRAPGGHVAARCPVTIVTFARLEQAEIDSYIDSGEWRGKAGGYAIQGSAARFVRFLSGSHSAVVGLPLHETDRLLRGLGYRP